MGSNIAAGESFQCVVPADCWFGAEVSGEGYSLVAPGFDFADFEMGSREDLLKLFPEQAEIIQRLARALFKKTARRYHDRTFTQTPQYTKIHF